MTPEAAAPVGETLVVGGAVVGGAVVGGGVVGGLVVADLVGLGELLVADAEGDLLVDGADFFGDGDFRPLADGLGE